MTNYLDITKAALAQIRAVHGGSYDLDQKCQQFVGYYMDWMLHGSESGIDTSGSALIAAGKNHLDTRDINSVPEGWLMYWSNNHIMRAVGKQNGRVVAANNSVSHGIQHILTLDPFLHISYADTYDSDKAGHYLGASPVDGHSSFGAPFPVDPWPNVPVPTSPITRVVAVEGATRRATPETPNGAALETMHKGFTHDYAAFVHSPLPGGVVGGSDVWFDGGGWFMHSSMFSDRSTTAMADETASLYPPAPPPPPAVVTHSVTLDLGDGSTPQVITVEDGQPVIAPTPTRTGFTFNSWRLDGGKFDLSNPIHGDITLTADWTAVPDQPAPDSGAPAEPADPPAEPDSGAPTEPTDPGAPDSGAPAEPDQPPEPGTPTTPTKPTFTMKPWQAAIIGFVTIIIGALAVWLG